MSGFRLDSGGRIDRGRRLGFTWDGMRREGFAGDTVASALLASGDRVLARSFKYHRPRGVMSAGVEEAGALVSTGTGASRVANVKASTAELVEGMAVSGQNAWPSVRFDLGAVNGLLSRFFAAGFYYKTFMGLTGRGTWEWMQFEKLIRRAAGMGRASDLPDPDHYEIVHDHCDVLIVGSGPAGLSAARAALSAGLDVMLAEQDFDLGGGLLTGQSALGAAWRGAALDALGKARCLPRTTVFGLYDHGVAGLLERVTDHLAQPPGHLPRERMRIVRAGRIVLATGAIERPVVFGDNDRPGVMLASAVQACVTRFAVAPGRRVALATTNDSAYPVAEALAGAGLEVTLLDARARLPGRAEAVRAAGAAVRSGVVPVRAHGSGGVRALSFGRHDGGGRAVTEDRLAVDTVAVAGGWTPVVNLISHRGIRPVWNPELSAFVVNDTGAEPVSLAGAAAGQFTDAAAVEGGARAGEEAAKALAGRRRRALPGPETGWQEPIAEVWEVRDPAIPGKGFVDPTHDVTVSDVRLAHREGYVSVEHLKRYTTLGMATDQGKMGNVIGLALMARQTGRTIPETGTTTFRPPYTPVSIGALAGVERGRHWRPTRLSPIHAEHVAAGAVFTDAGFWRRAWYYPRQGEDLAAAARRETLTVRRSVGLVDVSTLGKIMVQGPDGAEFLNRVYANGFAKLPVGKARYGLMLRDDGIVFDDGTVWRLTEHDWLMTTTTANAGAVMLHLVNLLQVRWPDLRVHVTSVSDQFAAVAVAGPRARAVLQGGCPDIDLAESACPPMAVRQGSLRVDGGTVPVTTARLSFSGELAWEVMCPADHGPAMWRSLLARVRAERGDAYGLEAMDCLRVEKGHVTGREIDGRTTPADLGLGAMASANKPHVGRVLGQRPDLIREDRARLVGLIPVDRLARFRAGALLFPEGEYEGHGLGHVSSIADSPALGCRIGLGFATGGLDRWQGRVVTAANPIDGQTVALRVVSPHFLDPEGARLHG